jgi:uncharacterized protein (TIGR04255 family)
MEHVKKLSKAPLKEVVFEVFWGNRNQQPEMRDSGFEFALGRFADQLAQNDFSTIERIVPEGIQIPRKATHRFKPYNSDWPIVQIGPGVLAVNDNDEKYVWEDSYKPLVAKSLQALFSSYRESSIDVYEANLSYIDAVPVVGDLLSFLDTVFKLRFDPMLQNIGHEHTEQIGWQQAVQVAGIGQVAFTINTSVVHNALCVFWKIEAKSRWESSPDTALLLDWLERTHTVLSNTFKKTLKEDFYESLK